jgi:hypothetical protein
MIYWIVLAAFLSFGCVGAGFLMAVYLVRRHYRKYVSRFLERESHYRRQEELLKESKEALREIMYRTHHHGLNPRAKTTRGLSGLGLLASGRLMNFLELLSRPNHHRYSKLAMLESKEIMMCFRMIESEMLQLEHETLNDVKEFEHLQ